MEPSGDRWQQEGRGSHLVELSFAWDLFQTKLEVTLVGLQTEVFVPRQAWRDSLDRLSGNMSCRSG